MSMKPNECLKREVSSWKCIRVKTEHVICHQVFHLQSSQNIQDIRVEDEEETGLRVVREEVESDGIPPVEVHHLIILIDTRIEDHVVGVGRLIVDGEGIVLIATDIEEGRQATNTVGEGADDLQIENSEVV